MFKLNQVSELQSKFIATMDASVALFCSSLDNCKKITFLQCEMVNNLLQEVALVAKNMNQVKTPLEATTSARDFIINSGQVIYTHNQEFVKILRNAKAGFIELTSQTVKTAQNEIVSVVNDVEIINPVLSGLASQPLQNMLNISNQTSEMVSDLVHKVDVLSDENTQVTAEVALQSLVPAS